MRLFWCLFIFTVLVLLASLLSLLGNYSLPPLIPSENGRAMASRWRPLRLRIGQRWKLIGWSLCLLVLLLASYGALLYFRITGPLIEANRFPAFWRSVNVFSGVSPLTPQILSLLGLYGWFWYAMKGLVLLSEDRPRLPRKEDLHPLLRLFSCEDRQRPLEKKSLPLGGTWLLHLAICFVVTTIVLRVALGDWGIRTLGEMSFGHLTFWWVACLAAIILADAWQVWSAWKSLRRLLVLLDQGRSAACAEPFPR